MSCTSISRKLATDRVKRKALEAILLPLLRLHLITAQAFSDEALEFQERIHNRNGLSEGTYCPSSLHAEPPLCTLEAAREEACMVLLGAVTEVLAKTGTACTHRL